MQGLKRLTERDEKIDYVRKIFEKKQFAVSQIKTATKIAEINDQIANGNIAIFIDGKNEAILIDFIHLEERAIEEPSTEMTIRGPDRKTVLMNLCKRT